MMTSITIGPLSTPDHRIISDLLNEAFCSDPVYRYVLDGCTPALQDHYRARLVRFIVGYHVRSGMPVWGVTQRGVLVACALVEVPGPGWRQALALFRQLPGLAGRVPWTSVQRLNRYARKSRQGLPKSFRYYLVKIGVAPNCQGQGFGKLLIGALVDHYRQPGETLALDTENPDNVPFYQHLGFQLHDEQGLGSLRIYRMHLPLE